MPAPKLSAANSDAAPVETPPAEPVDTQPPDTAADPQAGQAPTPQWGNWRHVGDIPRVYTAVPVTVEHGDVIEHLGPPADDGNWEPTDEAATRAPDNHPDTIAANHAATEAALTAPEEG
jgi:hypothetical protein